MSPSTRNHNVRPTAPKNARPAFSVLLVRLLRRFNDELFAIAAERGFADLRQAHLPVLGNLNRDGIRLTQLARECRLSMATTSELVTDLQALGYVQRAVDPSDGRARLITPTERGRLALDEGQRIVGEIEARWAARLGSSRFAAAHSGLAELHATLETPTQLGDSSGLVDMVTGSGR
jgi:DNA-binding MarR family transcriptional regulator